MPYGYDYDSPSLPFINNGISEPTSQRFHVSKHCERRGKYLTSFQDTCAVDFTVPIPDTPPFDLKYVCPLYNTYALN